MLVSSKELLIDARSKGNCIPQFNINNLEWTKTILEAANDLKYPIILGVSENAAIYMGGYNTVSVMVKSLMLDLNINIPVVLHLDHGKSVESCIKAIDSGFTSVMIDGSELDIGQNIEMTSKVVQYAHARNVTVEGEFGQISGVEDNVNNDEIYTDIDQAIKYVNATKVDSFAPSIGSKHGMDDENTKLNIPLLKELNMKLNIPLVLHGGSGINDEQLIEAIKNGVTKININTELQVEWSKQVREYLLRDKDVSDPRKIIGSGRQAMVDVIVDKINLFRLSNKDNS